MKRTILTTVLVLLLSVVPGIKAQDVEVHIGQQKELTEAQKDSIYLTKLTPDQLLELKRMEMEVEKERIEARSEQVYFGNRRDRSEPDVPSRKRIFRLEARHS